MKNTLFYQYIISHILSMLIPLVIILLFLNLSFMKLVKEQSLENEKKNLDLIIRDVDSLFKEMDQLTEQIQVNKSLRPFKLTFNPYHGLTIIEKLQSYSTVNTIIEGIILNFYADENYYFTDQTSLEKKSINYHYKLPALYDWEELLNPTVRSIISLDSFYIFDQKISGVLLFSYPLYNVKQYGSVVFIIPKEKIIAQILLVISRNGMLKIYDCSDENKRELLNFTSDLGEENDLIMLQQCSEKTGLYYEFFVPKGQLYSSVKMISRVIFIMIFAILFLGIVIAITGSLWNYHRLDRLRKRFEELQIDYNGTDILDYIGNSLTDITTQLNESSQPRKESLIRGLLRDNYEKKECFNKEAASIGLSLDWENYHVAVLNLPKKVMDQRAAVIEKIEKYSFREISVLAISDILTDTILMVVNYHSTLEKKEVEDRLTRFFLSLKEEVNADITMGISGSGSKIFRLAERKKEAFLVSELKFIYGWGKIYHYGEYFTRGKDHPSYPIQLLNGYRSALISGKRDKISESIDNMISHIQEKKIPIYMTRGLCYELISIIHINLFTNFDQFHKTYRLQTLDINQFDTLNDFGDFLKDFLDETIHDRKDEKEIVNPMADYIKDNYRDVNFSLTQMADAFNMTIPNLCHLFKEEIGTTILDFTSRLRMNDARKQLESTKLSIGEIAFEVGYANTNSFIRRFRQLNGVTPGEFRKNNLKKSR